MALLVKKFGGTSVGTPELIQAAADKVISARAQGHEVVVVVSAMGEETDRLVDLAYAISERPDPREYDVLISSGELISMSLMAMALIAKGCPARSYSGPQVKIYTDNVHKKARILGVENQALNNDLAQGVVPVIAGFQGISLEGELMTLGRGGSDTTAVALADALKADECQIYTDVEGVYTTDPRVVADARMLTSITFEEILEMARLGAKVLQVRAVELAGKHQVPVRVLSSFVEGPGTLISYQKTSFEDTPVTGIAFSKNEVMISIFNVPDYPSVRKALIQEMAKENIEIEIIAQVVIDAVSADVIFTVHRDEYLAAWEVIQRLKAVYRPNKIYADTTIARISLIGKEINHAASLISEAQDVLQKERIAIKLIKSSPLSVSLFIDQTYLEQGVQALHQAFNLDKQPEKLTTVLDSSLT